MNVEIVCGECGRVFDLSNNIEAEEWVYGHDCEVKGVKENDNELG